MFGEGDTPEDGLPVSEIKVEHFWIFVVCIPGCDSFGHFEDTDTVNVF